MGCAASAQSNPTPENVCGDGDTLNMTKDVESACFFTTEIGQYCDGTLQKCFGEDQGSTEWVPAGGGVACGVCSSCKGLEQGTGNGLCGFGSGSCSWAGQRQRCQRIAFNGDALKCCRRSKFINGSNLFCFDDNSKLRTCDPQYRGFAQPSCTPVMATYCSDDSEEPYKSKWIGTSSTKDCRRFVQENAGKEDFYGPVIEAMITRYFLTENNPITSFETDGANHDPFVETILEICRENPGACDDVLTTKCAGITRDQMSQNVNLANLCGCFMADAEYAQYSSFGINRECDPVCALGSSVHLFDTTSSNPAKFKDCTDSICVIDDITINVLANSVVGDISFSQACGSCSSNSETSSCRCYINDTSINAINSLIGDVSFTQSCGGNPLCYKSAPVAGAPPIPIDCNTGEEIPTSAVGQSISRDRRTYLWIIASILIGIILLIIFFSVSKPPQPIPPVLIPGEKGRKTRPMIASVKSN